MKTTDRRPLYAKIAIARKQLPYLDEEGYRALLREKFGKESAKELNYYQLDRLIHALVRLGARLTTQGNNNRVRSHARPDWYAIPDDVENAPLKRQIVAIWKKLGYSMTSLETRVRRQFGVHTFMWLHDHEKLSALLTDLQHREKSLEKKQAVRA